VTSVLNEEFSQFVERTEPRLRRALVAAYGSERGREATAEALAYAWEHWDAMQEITNQIAYLYRVGQSRTRLRRSRPLFVRSQDPEPWFEPNLVVALERLTESQRTAVVLVHGFGLDDARGRRVHRGPSDQRPEPSRSRAAQAARPSESE